MVRIESPYARDLAQQSDGESAAGTALYPGARAGWRLVDQRPDGQSRFARRLRRMGIARRHRLELGRRSAVFQEARAGYGFRRPAPWQGRPHPDHTDHARIVERARQSGGRSVPRDGLRLSTRPERRVRRRIFPAADREYLRHARFGADGLSRPRHAHASESADVDRDASHRTAVRWPQMHRRQGAHRRPGCRLQRPGSHHLVRRHLFAGASVCAPVSGPKASCAIWEFPCGARCRAWARG